jgi:hypothetical protein
MRLNRQVLKAARATGNTYGTMLALNNLGDLNNLRQTWRVAIEHFDEALQLARTAGYHGYIGPFLVNRAVADLGRRAFDECRRHASEALAAAREQGDRQCEVGALEVAARLALAEADVIEARRISALAMQAASAIGSETLTLTALGLGAHVLAAEGERIRAGIIFERLLRHPATAPADRPGLQGHVATLHLSETEQRLVRARAHETSIASLVDDFRRSDPAAPPLAA